MDLSTFSEEIMPIIQGCLTLIGLLSLFLLWWQIRQTNMWNKLNNPRNFLNIDLTMKLESDCRSNLAKISIDVDSKSPLTETEANATFTDKSVLHFVKSFLNDIENLCAAVGIGSLDSDNAYAVHSSRVIRSFYKFESLIKVMRHEYTDDELYIEFEKVATLWKTKHEANVKAQKAILDKSKEKLKKVQGVPKKA